MDDELGMREIDYRRLVYNHRQIMKVLMDLIDIDMYATNWRSIEPIIISNIDLERKLGL